MKSKLGLTDFEQLLENSKDLIYRYEFLPKRGFTFVNTAITLITGYTVDDFYGDSDILYKLVYPDDLSLFEEVWGGNNFTEQSIVLRWVSKDGNIHWVEQNNNFIYNESDELIAIEGIARDITNRLREDNQIEGNINKYKAVFDSSTASIAIVSLSGELTVNQAFCQMLGYSIDEIKNKSWKDFTHPEDINLSQDMINSLINGKVNSAHFVKRYIRKNGQILWGDINTTLQRSSDGEPLYFITVLIDITESKRTEAKLSELFELEKAARIEAEKAKDSLSFLSKSSLLVTETFDYQNRLERVAEIAVPTIADWCAIDLLETDQSLHRVTVVHSDPDKIQLAYDLQHRYPPDKNSPHGIYEVLRTGRSQLFTDIPDAMLVAGAKDEEHLKILRSLGFSSAMVVPFQAHGNIFGAITLVTAESGRHYNEDDLTLIEDLAHRTALLIDNARLYAESHKLNAELERRVRERTSELEAINQELEAFTYSVSHDLRAPLRHIAGYAELLSKAASVLDEKNQRYLNTIMSSINQMGILIDDLLSFSRMGRVDLQKNQINFRALVEAVINDLKEDFSTRKVEWDIDDLPQAYGDQAMLKLVFTNLILNALKFSQMRSLAKIKIGFIATNPDEIIYYVRDNGVGFDMRYADKLFGIFQRLHRTGEFEGTGVGLANVKRIIQRHRGRVWAESELDHGATFYISLPIHKENES